MLKKPVVYLLVLLISCHGKDKKIDCTSLKKGKFYYNGYVIERDDSIQTESDISRRITIKKKINWVSDCEYELTYLSGRETDTLPDGGIIVLEKKEKTQKIKIIEVTKNFYVFETMTSTGETLRDKVRIGPVGGFKSIGDIFPEK